METGKGEPEPLTQPSVMTATAKPTHEFTEVVRLVWSPPQVKATHPQALWQPTGWKYGGVRVWARNVQPGEAACLHLVGRFGSQRFYGFSQDRIPAFV